MRLAAMTGSNPALDFLGEVHKSSFGERRLHRRYGRFMPTRVHIDHLNTGLLQDLRDPLRILDGVSSFHLFFHVETHADRETFANRFSYAPDDLAG